MNGWFFKKTAMAGNFLTIAVLLMSQNVRCSLAWKSSILNPYLSILRHEVTKMFLIFQKLQNLNFILLFKTQQIETFVEMSYRNKIIVNKTMLHFAACN